MEMAEVKENYIDKGMVSERSERWLELDVYVPKCNIAFEYQGQNHYFDIYSMGSKWSQRLRDTEKRGICQGRGITLIEVPYWWDSNKDSLMATIHSKREDLFPSHKDVQPIPSEPPSMVHGLEAELVTIQGRT